MLRDTFWFQVDRHVGPKPSGRRRLKNELMKIRHRDKNTFTSWLSKPLDQRPDVRLTDLEDVAAALQVSPADLVTPETPNVSVSSFQLELPFGTDTRRLTLELDATDSVIRMRVSRKSV